MDTDDSALHDQITTVMRNKQIQKWSVIDVKARTKLYMMVCTDDGDESSA